MHCCIKKHNSNQKCPFSSQKPNETNLTLTKIGRGQSKVIIYTNLKGLSPQMLNTKFQGNRSSGFGKNFLRFLPYLGMMAILVM